MASLTVPYTERIDQVRCKSIAEVTEALGKAAQVLTARTGGAGVARGLTTGVARI
jgi:hypothetical protein